MKTTVDVKYPRKSRGIAAGIITFVFLDGFWILTFPINVALSLSKSLETAVEGLGIILAIALFCAFFGYSIARNLKNLIVISSILLMIPFAFDIRFVLFRF
jgi:hypothetical protein